MKVLQLLISLIFVCCFFSCKSTVKEQRDKVYSRHLQKNIDLTIVTSGMPSKKEEMNLLLFHDIKILKKLRATEILDSLSKKKAIKPLLIIGISGEKIFYGLEELDHNMAKQYKKYNSFIVNELYPFAKKKTGIRKFKTVAIAGFNTAALSSFDIAWNNDEKIGLVGMFGPSFGDGLNDSLVLQTIDGLRKRPNLKIWIASNEKNSSAFAFKKMMDAKKSISECTLTNENDADFFASFLLWAFPK